VFENKFLHIQHITKEINRFVSSKLNFIGVVIMTNEAMLLMPLLSKDEVCLHIVKIPVIPLSN
jgi:hypothetical protein